MNKPRCKKCGSLHYNVVACAVIPPVEPAPQPAGKPANGPVAWKGSMEGFKPFGNASDSFEIMSGTFMRKEK